MNEQSGENWNDRSPELFPDRPSLRVLYRIFFHQEKDFGYDAVFREEEKSGILKTVYNIFRGKRIPTGIAIAGDHAPFGLGVAKMIVENLVGTTADHKELDAKNLTLRWLTIALRIPALTLDVVAAMHATRFEGKEMVTYAAIAAALQSLSVGPYVISRLHLNREEIEERFPRWVPFIDKHLSPQLPKYEKDTTGFFYDFINQFSHAEDDHE
jgi:hypothetical protein